MYLISESTQNVIFLSRPIHINTYTLSITECIHIIACEYANAFENDSIPIHINTYALSIPVCKHFIADFFGNTQMLLKMTISNSSYAIFYSFESFIFYTKSYFTNRSIKIRVWGR